MIRSMLRLGLVAAITLLPRPATGQDAPDRNPIFLSIAGTNAEPDIFRDVSLTTYQLLTGSLQFEKKDDSAKLVFAPFKLSETYRPVWSELGLNFAQSKGITTFGVGVAYNPYSTFSEAAGKDLAEALAVMKTFRDQRQGESDEEYTAARDVYNRALWATIFDDFYKRQASRAWIISGALNLQTFGVVAGDKIDANEDRKIDNHYKTKGFDASVTFSYSHNQAMGITGSAHFGKRRMSSVEGQPLEFYPGWSVAVARRAKVLNPNYAKTDDYRKSLFIPSVIVGASYEWERCGGTATTCDDRRRSQASLTPFFEVKVTPQAQFRLGVPIRRTVLFGGTTQTELAPAIQYVLQLTGVK